MDPENKPKGPSPHYSLYQREIFKRGGETGQLPSFSVHPEELQESTKKKLNDRGYFYANSNAGIGWTDRANREAFYRWRIIPRTLVDTNTRDLTSMSLSQSCLVLCGARLCCSFVSYCLFRL